MTNQSFTPKTFPGVYTQINDKSFFIPRATRFKPGLIGVASKGPFNTPTVVQSLREFVEVFGNPIPTPMTTDSSGNVIPNGPGYYLADAVDACSGYTNSITVVRIGKTSTTLPDSDAIGTLDASMFSSVNNASRINSLMSQGSVYVSIKQAGKISTVNALVTSAGSGTVSLNSTYGKLQDTYTTGQITYSIGDPAANAAESILYCYTYGSNSSQQTDNGLTTFGNISGYKNNFQFNVVSNAANIVVGGVYKIMQTDKATTHEIRVASVVVNNDGSGVVYLDKVSNQQIGYQALPLQDNYATGTLYRATGKQPFLYLSAGSEGTWANGSSAASGLYTKVRPGSDAGTKKLEVYWNSALVETHDNISDNPTSANYWLPRLAKGNSDYVYVTLIGTPPSNVKWTAANAADPWDSRFYSAGTVGTVLTMPQGALNDGQLTINSTATDTGGQFHGGANGENASASDWIGTLDPTTDKLTGIRSFENRRRVDVSIIAAPQQFAAGNEYLTILNQLADTCQTINAMAVVDVPAGLNGRQAIDWHNGQLNGQNGQRLDSKNVACFWNWGYRTNRFGDTKLVPPTVFWLGRAGFTYNAFAPWYAIAGETRGYVQDCQRVQFPDVSEDTLQAMYGNGNSVNPILELNGSFFLYGERTMQRQESKLTAIHSVICVNWIVNGMATVARRYVFDPNDAELLDALNLSFTEFLNKIKNDRGIEVYSLSVTATAENRNNREVMVDLAVVPTDVAERIYINATVYESGAQINSIA